MLQLQLRAGFTDKMLEEELSLVERRAYTDQSKIILEKLEDDGGASRSAASQRQLEVKAKQEEKERKEKEKGPGWYYVVERCKPKTVIEPDSDVLIGNFQLNRCCTICEEAIEKILKCKGPCGSHFHPSCLSMDLVHGIDDYFQVHPVPIE